MMSLLRIFHVSGSAVSAQSQRLNTVSSNLANADTAAGPDGKSFKARQVVFQTLPMSDDASSVGVKVSAVREDDTPGRRIHDPAHPNADAEGYVTFSNVNPVDSMVSLISLARQFEMQIKMLQTADSNASKANQILSMN